MLAINFFRLGFVLRLPAKPDHNVGTAELIGSAKGQRCDFDTDLSDKSFRGMKAHFVMVQKSNVPKLERLRPMLLDTRKHLPFSDPAWIFELKNDGYRMLAEFGENKVGMRTRGGHDCVLWFPEVAEALARYSGGSHIVDGEVCVMDDLGRSDFDRLQDRARRRCYYPDCDPVVFAMFDLLVDHGENIMGLPLVERKARLKKLFTPKPRKTLLVIDAIPEHGIELYAMAEELKLEGLVAKRASSIYVPGERTTDWKKIKVPGAVPPERFRRGK
jgi:bifunctional non-homologous end joining protein LigD